MFAGYKKPQAPPLTPKSPDDLIIHVGKAPVSAADYIWKSAGRTGRSPGARKHKTLT